MHSIGIPDIQKAATKHTQRKLEKEFGNFLLFVSCYPKKILVYPDNIKVADVLKENYLLEHELKWLNRIPDQKMYLMQQLG